MNDDLEFFTGDLMPDEMRLLLRPCQGSDIAEISGAVRGPFCDFSTTLTADFRLQKAQETDSVEAIVLDPCYWTPYLPFLYEFHLTLKMIDGSEQKVLARAGATRLHCESDNLRMDLKRMVLRGIRCDTPDEKTLQEARENETALIVDDPNVRICELASRLGVPLIVDLRRIQQPWQEVCRQLDWFPAVILVLLSEEQLVEVDNGRRCPQHSFVALGTEIDSPADQIAKLSCDMLAVELLNDQRPPAWIKDCGRPVIAIRVASADPDMLTARVGCDRLQAELAPEFDLAGYFVSP